MNFEYAIAEAEGAEQLELVVSKMIREGWRPQGGVTAVITTQKALAGLAQRPVYAFYQAMARTDAPDWRGDDKIGP